RQSLATEIAALEDQRSQLNGQLERQKQELSSLQQNAIVRRESLNQDIARNEQAVAQLNTSIESLNGQKERLKEEITEAQRKKQQEAHDLELLARDKEEIIQKIAQANQQFTDINIQIESYSGTLDELKNRGVALNQEIPVLTQKRDVLKQELSDLEKTRLEIEAAISRANQESQRIVPNKTVVVELPKPYAVMVLDVDNTITDITTPINPEILNQLLDFLTQNVRIALVTAQSMEEVKRYIIDQVPSDKKALLMGLTVYPASGAKCYTFNALGQALNDSDYDSTVGLTLISKPQEVENAIRTVVGSSAGIGLRDGLITITGLSNRDRTYGELTSLFKEEGWHLVPRLAGNHSIHVLIGGVSKAKAATHFIKEVVAKSFRQQIPNSQILVVGDSFYAGGLDADLISALPQADVVSVGKKIQGKQLRDLEAQGLLFSDDLVGGRNWQATLKILREINKGKSVRQINSNSTPHSRSAFRSGLASFLLVLATSAFTLFPIGFTSAQPLQQPLTINQTNSNTNDVIKQLIEDLKDDSKRENAFTALTKIGLPAARDLMAGVGTNWNPHNWPTSALEDLFHQDCQQILDSFGDKVKDVYISVAKDQDSDLGARFAAIKYLSKYKDKSIVDMLYDLLTTDKKGQELANNNGKWFGVLDQSADTLQHIGTPEAIDALNRALSNDDVKVRDAAGQALANMGDKGVQSFIDIFTSDNYVNHMDKVLLRINTIKDDHIDNDKIRNSLNWVISDAQLPNGSIYVDVVKAATETLFSFGDDGIKTLAETIKSPNLIRKNGTLKTVLESTSEAVAKVNYVDWQSEPLPDAIAHIGFNPTNDGSYNADVTALATKILIQFGDSGVSRIKDMFNPTNYGSLRPVMFQALNDSGIQDDDLIQKLYWVVLDASSPDNSFNPVLTQEAGKTLYKLQGLQAITKFNDAIKGGNSREQDGGAIAILAIARTQSGNIDSGVANALEQIKKLDSRFVDSTQNQHKPLSQEADELLNTNPEHLRGKLFFHHGFHKTAEALRNYYKDKSWGYKFWNYLLSYIADAQYLIIEGIFAVIIGIIHYVRGKRTKAVYKQLVSYIGQTTSWGERSRFKQAAARIARGLDSDFSDSDVYRAIADKLPDVYRITRNERIEKIGSFLDKLKKSKLNSPEILRYGVPFMAKTATDEKQFEQGLDILSDTVQELQKHNVRPAPIFSYSLASFKDYVNDLSVFKSVCDLMVQLASKKLNVQEMLSKVLPGALKSASDDKTKIERIKIILKLLSDGIYPTQLLIETLQKTTSAAASTQQISKFSDTLNDFKKGSVKFDINNPIDVELEYTTYRQLAKQVSSSDDYENYQSLIQQFRSHSESSSGLPSQERAEVKLAVYEAYRLLDFVVAVKDQADKIRRPVWVIPNLTYGKFAVSPILDELGKLNIEVHYAKVGSTGAHEHPEYTVPGLFTDDVYFRILKERPILIVVDGTQHLMPRPEEGKSSRYPDAYVGYRNLATALDEAISDGRQEKFLDKVHISKDFLNTLHHNDDYTGLVRKLEKLNTTLDQPQILYKLGFWNPAGLPLVIREARKEVQKVSVFNPKDLDSPTLLFINSPLLDEDLPADIKKWAGLEEAHIPAYFDDKTQ
ncbi:MAG: hypothetical protein KGJ11_05275, partial [Candidatus Omnitrophica bacterium]|nr:hypothetical protein [Candidatus Omnitrophota bacterium]